MAALGTGLLYGSAVASFGWFHLLDDPVFLAAAAFVAIDSLGRGRHNDLALALLRVGAGITLMWAGAEKWLYPWWSEGMPVPRTAVKQPRPSETRVAGVASDFSAKAWIDSLVKGR